MPDLPEGTVTLLFTDMEGSTRLLQQRVANARMRLGEQTFDEAWSQGRAMTPEQALTNVVR